MMINAESSIPITTQPSSPYTSAAAAVFLVSCGNICYRTSAGTVIVQDKNILAYSFYWSISLNVLWHILSTTDEGVTFGEGRFLRQTPGKYVKDAQENSNRNV